MDEFTDGNNDEITAAAAHGAAAADVVEITIDEDAIAVGVVEITIDVNVVAAGVDETTADVVKIGRTNRSRRGRCDHRHRRL